MSPGGRRPSMADVAGLADVSYQTVSRVLNEPDLVRPETRERVLAAISDLGYTRNRAARALKTTRSSVIGVLTDGSALFGPSQVTTAIESAARQAGYATLLTTAHPDRDERAIGAELLGSGAEGILVVAPFDSMVPAVEAVARSTPVISVSAEPLNVPGVTVVGVDQQLGARQAVEHLVSVGCSSVVHAPGPGDWFDARARRRGFEQALDDFGIDGDLTDPGDWSPRSGYEIGIRLMDGALPDAVFAANDLMAFGIIHAFHERGVRIPGDVAVMGFDDIPGAEFLTPALSTVTQPFSEVGRTALELLVCALDGGDGCDELPRTIPTALVARDSTRR